jgi:hypothetical protein
MGEESKPISEDLQRASNDLTEAIHDLSGDYALLGQTESAFEWLRAIDRCEKDSANVSAKFAALRIAVLKEPFKK